MVHAGARTAGLAARASALATPGPELQSELTGAAPERGLGGRRHLDWAYIMTATGKRKGSRQSRSHLAASPRAPKRPREIAGWPVTGAWKLTSRTRTPRSQPCALYQCPGSWFWGSGSGTESWSPSEPDVPVERPRRLSRSFRAVGMSRRDDFLPSAEIPKHKSDRGAVALALGCERGVRISLVSFHAPVTGHPAISRGQAAVRGATRVARVGTAPRAARARGRRVARRARRRSPILPNPTAPSPGSS